MHDPHLSVAGDRLKFAIAHDDSSCLRFLCYTAYSIAEQSIILVNHPFCKWLLPGPLFVSYESYKCGRYDSLQMMVITS